jgi:hypothetical protein
MATRIENSKLHTRPQAKATYSVGAGTTVWTGRLQRYDGRGFPNRAGLGPEVELTNVA